jgi:hypothetical protein
MRFLHHRFWQCVIAAVADKDPSVSLCQHKGYRGAHPRDSIHRLIRSLYEDDVRGPINSASGKKPRLLLGDHFLDFCRTILRCCFRRNVVQDDSTYNLGKKVQSFDFACMLIRHAIHPSVW